MIDKLYLNHAANLDRQFQRYVNETRIKQAKNKRRKNIPFVVGLAPTIN